jgi:hypothetical protein
MYGLFYDAFAEDEGNILLGVYFLEGEAVAAREQYITEEVSTFPPDVQASARKYNDAKVYVTQLPIGSTPDLFFVKR